MRIGELARRSDTAVETVRYYEREGLLPAAARSEGNYRDYGEAALARLKFIRHCRALDLSLAEIRELLAVRDAPRASCAGVTGLIESHLAHVEQRIAELQQLRGQLEVLRESCTAPGEGAQCGILARLEHEGTPAAAAPPPGPLGHLR
ncbi:Cd(II)/Pb(II)-responsive transcriptional regulator [Caldimonas tepidiphila]|uniref:Cd(II)/Pb(II)-responsive transcriptional regulator n=1 Tax=Caldimonas tepidiphila TaxID=2315841 RepID=UPI000E5C3F51|nr:Cd(II)/Pb(II)-responsive transcriptional regulator [Caldimonas tepidiphila]